MKVAFYLENKAFPEVDCCFPEKGNPGIGGSQYMVLSIAKELAAQPVNAPRLVLFANTKANLPESIDVKCVKNVDEAILSCPGLGIDYLVLQYNTAQWESGMFEPDRAMKIVIWAHNIVPNHHLTRMALNKQIAAIVCVGREQLDLYRDHEAYKKSTYIYNGIYPSSVPKTVPAYSERQNDVTYIGSLVFSKGFHILAKAWPKVLKAVPNARLNVIGSGKLYDRNAKLGKYGIAQDDYENTFMPYLCDSKGEILNSVKFWGVLGVAKNDVLLGTKVGVPNPSGFTETFCISAVEMQLCGCLVATKKYVGYLDTVPKPNVLIKNTENNLHKTIIALLKKNSYPEQATTSNKLLDKFAMEVVRRDWISFFSKLEKGKVLENKEPMAHPGYNLKWLREFNHKLKKILPGGDKLPTIDILLSILRKIGIMRNPIKY